MYVYISIIYIYIKLYDTICFPSFVPLQPTLLSTIGPCPGARRCGQGHTHGGQPQRWASAGAAAAWLGGKTPGSWSQLGVSENSVHLNPMVLLILIPFLNGYNWEYTLFSDKPSWMMGITLWWTVTFCHGKIHPCFMGKSTISMLDDEHNPHDLIWVCLKMLG